MDKPKINYYDRPAGVSKKTKEPYEAYSYAEKSDGSKAGPKSLAKIATKFGCSVDSIYESWKNGKFRYYGGFAPTSSEDADD